MIMRAELMNKAVWVNKGLALAMGFSALFATLPGAFAGESSMPPSWVDNVSPELAAK